MNTNARFEEWYGNSMQYLAFSNPIDDAYGREVSFILSDESICLCVGPCVVVGHRTPPLPPYILAEWRFPVNH